MVKTVQISWPKLMNEDEIPGIGDIIGKVMKRAFSICFDYNNHKMELIFDCDYVLSDYEYNNILNTEHHLIVIEDIDAITHKMKSQWGDPDVAAEWGAYGISILIIFELSEYTAIERSRKGTGFDFWLAKKDNLDEMPFKREARLEVSGMLKAGTSNFNKRVKEKVEQSKVSDKEKIPAFAFVMEFSKPRAKMVKRCID